MTGQHRLPSFAQSVNRPTATYFKLPFRWRRSLCCEAYEEAFKVRIALLAVLSARDVTNVESDISIRKDAGPEGNSLALGNVVLIDLKRPGLMARPRSVSRPKRVVSLKLLEMFVETAR